jgi:membrane-associated protein
MTWLVENIRWLIGLADPKNLREVVQAMGPVWVYGLLTAIIFSETGLLIGFFLPGDSLLFAAGFLASAEVFNIGILLALLCAAAIIGDAINYYVGLQMGEYVFERGRLRFVKHSHLLAAKAFYDKHGGKAIVLARFIPIVRTFTPFVAGVAKMGYRQFAIFNIIGGIGWVVSMTAAGYWLGRIPWVQSNFEKVVIAIVVVSVLPVFVEVAKHWWTARLTVATKPAPPADVS